MSSTGLITIEFSEPLVVPSNYLSFNDSIITISVIPGEDSDKNNLKFSWKVISMNST